MITNLFHSNSDLIGINFERLEDGRFVVCVAFKINNKWTAKSLGGIYGDMDDKKLIDHVIQMGQSLDKETASNFFTHLTDKDNYSTK
jgi:hypothetical protein